MPKTISSLLKALDSLSRERKISQAVTASSLLFFIVFVVGPLFFIFTKLSNFKFQPPMQDALALSFILAFAATAIDLLFGIPLAWALAKKKFPLKDLADTIIDLPLVVPTSALGLSVALFWGSGGAGLFAPGFELLLILHVVFTFPYVVRTTQAAMMAVDEDIGRAAHSLGASPLFSFRSVWLPLFRAGALSGAILAFTRSLGETGATLLVGGVLQTVPVLTVYYKNSAPPDMDAAISISAILVALSAILFLFMRSKLELRRFSLGRAHFDAEKRLSRYSTAGLFAGMLFFLFLVLLPSLYFLKFTDFELFAPKIMQAIAISFAVGISATIITMLFGLPFSLYISSKSKLSEIFRLANDMALLMPTVTIGLSLSLFWAGKLDERILLVFTSIAVIFPYFASTVSEVLASMDKGMVEVARSLGARPFYAFRTITFPLIIPTFVAGTMIAFMRSVAETGSTLAVSQKVETIPILIVNLYKAGKSAEAASAAVLLLAVSIVVVIFVRSLQKKKW